MQFIQAQKGIESIMLRYALLLWYVISDKITMIKGSSELLKPHKAICKIVNQWPRR